MKKELSKISQDEIQVFPKDIGLILLSIFIMMLAQALAFFTLGFYFIGLSVEPLIILLMLSSVLVVVPNVLISRGFSLARKCLMFFSGVYILIGLLAFVPVFDLPIPIFFPVSILMLSSAAIYIFSTKRYHAVLQFYSRR